MEEASYYEWLEKKVKSFVSRSKDRELADCIRLAPDLFTLLLAMLRDPKIPLATHKLTASILSYFLLPTDLVPEAFLGVHGLKDDVFLVAVFLDRLKQLGQSESVESNWRGQSPVYSSVSKILSYESRLVSPEIASALRKAVLARL